MEIVGRPKIIILIFGISMCIYIYGPGSQPPPTPPPPQGHGLGDNMMRGTSPPPLWEGGGVGSLDDDDG